MVLSSIKHTARYGPAWFLERYSERCKQLPMYAVFIPTSSYTITVECIWIYACYIWIWISNVYVLRCPIFSPKIHYVWSYLHTSVSAFRTVWDTFKNSTRVFICISTFMHVSKWIERNYIHKPQFSAANISNFLRPKSFFYLFI